MSMTISGLGSGLPIEEWVTKLVAVKQADIDKITAEKTTATNSNSALSTIKSSYSSLLSSLQTLTDAKFGSTSDVFAQNKVTTSDSSVLSASVTSLAAKQTLNVLVSQLATSTTATSGSVAAKMVDANTTVSSLAKGSVTEGNFSVYVDNTKYSISVASTDKVSDILGRISSATGLWAGIKDGKITLADSEPAEGATPTSTHNIVVGSNSDTTNFATVMGLKKNTQGAYQSNKTNFQTNTSVALTSANAGFASTIQTGSFKIGSATFTIDSTKTMDELLAEINSSTEAGVSAYWDSSAGKMVLTSKTQGAFNINIENLSGNFTDVMGLTTSTYDGQGAVTSSKLKDNTQEIGKNAIFKLNGTEIVASSNTITSDISGITGLTFTLSKESTDNKASTITVSSDTSTLTSALKTFVSNFNTVISQTDEATGSEGYLYGESTLTMIRNNIRMTATAGVEGQAKYNSLASIGITTGAVGASISAETNKLSLDTTKLEEALADDPEAVKALLLGDGTNKGVIEKLKTLVDGSLDTENGYFVTRAKTYDAQLTDLTNTITKQNDALKLYQTDLETKFGQMDQLIASMNSQFSQMKSTLASITG